MSAIPDSESSSRQQRANAIRFLSMDAVQKANSGHPGMPMGMADIAEVLWHDFLQHNPTNPHWANRDRFVLSNGHGCMLLYSLLHLSGYDVTIDDLQHFRQLHSRTPGHPELGYTPGVETTTGPLGQGLANAVGMAIAEKHLSAQFNRPDFPIIDHYTYCFVGDGCLMEGISHEACSLAGVLGLGKLIVLYDDNDISIDGEVKGWFGDNTPLRFQAYHWHVIPHVDGHNSEAIRQAIIEAQQVTDRPTLICCKTTIGWGSPNLAGKAATHGAPLGAAEIDAVRQKLEWPHPAFFVPEDIYAGWSAIEEGYRREAEWDKLFAAYNTAYPDLAKDLTRRLHKQLPLNWAEQTENLLESMQSKKQSIASRKASQQCLDHFAPLLPELIGGSADLTESNCTNWKSMELFTRDHAAGRYLHYGVREFGMSAIMNGLALYGGLIPFGGTFLTFSDYARNAIRLAAFMQQQVIFIYTHDSIGLGEDGPTHQPVEHLPSLRLIPGLSTWRPCDTVETAAAWRAALERQGPTCLLLSRQNLNFMERDTEQLSAIQYGGYILYDAALGKEPDAIFIATGSEIALAVDAAKALEKETILVRVVSMPSTDVFLAQEKSYRDQVLLPHVPVKLAIEAAASMTWHTFVGEQGQVIGLDEFGASAPAHEVFKDKGFTIDNIVTTTKELIYAAAQKTHAFQQKCVSGLSN
jgi:transketolase